MQNNWRTNSHQKKQVGPILGLQSYSLDDFITFLCRKVALYKSNDLSSIFSGERERERVRERKKKDYSFFKHAHIHSNIHIYSCPVNDMWGRFTLTRNIRICESAQYESTQWFLNNWSFSAAILLSATIPLRLGHLPLMKNGSKALGI